MGRGETNSEDMRGLMHGPYSAQLLTLEKVPQAFPLISITAPGLTLERWEDYAASFVGTRAARLPGEIVTVQTSDGYIHGLAICHPKPDLHHGRMLDVENFITLDLTGGRRAAGVLLTATEDRARVWNCAYITVSLLGTGNGDLLPHGHPAVMLLRTAGYCGEPKRLAKCLKAA